MFYALDYVVSDVGAGLFDRQSGNVHRFVFEVAISLELEQFDGVAPFADENIDVSIQDILFHVTGNDGRESMEAFSHIGSMTTQKIPGLLREVKHHLRDERFEIF